MDPDKKDEGIDREEFLELERQVNEAYEAGKLTQWALVESVVVGDDTVEFFRGTDPNGQEVLRADVPPSGALVVHYHIMHRRTPYGIEYFNMGGEGLVHATSSVRFASYPTYEEFRDAVIALWTVPPNKKR